MLENNDVRSTSTFGLVKSEFVMSTLYDKIKHHNDHIHLVKPPWFKFKFRRERAISWSPSEKVLKRHGYLNKLVHDYCDAAIVLLQLLVLA